MEHPLPGASLFQIYSRSKFLSIKHSSYFHVYEALFKTYIGQKFVFVEVGVLNGGSLFMWREYFGEKARIIGVDLNPAAKRWEADGFEIHIGNQSDPAFWVALFARIGPIDVLLDDGGHTNRQQIITVDQSIPHIRDGGLIAVEDTHCSYFLSFGNPSKYSFISFAKRLVDHIHARHPSITPLKNNYGSAVSSIRFFESIVVFDIDRRLCFKPEPTSNNGTSADAKDFRYEGSLASTMRIIEDKLDFLAGVPILWRVRSVFPRIIGLISKFESWKIRRLLD